MRIAVINEDSQADKHELICSTLADVVSQYGHDVISLGMVNEKDQHEINFTEIGVLASVLIECGIADFVVTGCGTGQGAMMSCNSFPNLYCGYVNQPLDAYLFAQVNAEIYLDYNAGVTDKYIYLDSPLNYAITVNPNNYSEGKVIARVSGSVTDSSQIDNILSQSIRKIAVPEIGRAHV